MSTVGRFRVGRVGAPPDETPEGHYPLQPQFWVELADPVRFAHDGRPKVTPLLATATEAQYAIQALIDDLKRCDEEL